VWEIGTFGSKDIRSVKDPTIPTDIRYPIPNIFLAAFLTLVIFLPSQFVSKNTLLWALLHSTQLLCASMRNFINALGPIVCEAENAQAAVRMVMADRWEQASSHKNKDGRAHLGESAVSQPARAAGERTAAPFHPFA
jgi:hypothetical protein